MKFDKKVLEIAQGYFHYSRDKKSPDSIRVDYYLGKNYDCFIVDVYSSSEKLTTLFVYFNQFDIFDDDFNGFNCGVEVAKIEEKKEKEKRLEEKKKI